MKLKALQFSTIMIYALVLGVFWGTWFSQSRTMELLSPETFLENGRQYIANLAMPMRILMPGSILLTFLTAFFIGDRKSPAFYGALAAGLLMVVALIITLSVNVPIDNQIKTWTLQSLPTDWGRIRDRWEFFHFLRTWVSIAGFAFLVGGTLANRA
ncbi:MAG: Protein of unknown function transrane [Fibrobacteres bacterium]|nr:Protein of unknown function transrane [Fibrobacterota bacterium]